MATITLGGSNGIVWDGNTKTKAQFAAASSNVTTASSNITLDACSFNNKVAASPKFVDINGENGFQGNVTISSNTEELVIDSNTEGAGLFGVESVTVNSGVYVWSDNTSNAALKISLNDVSVVNNGIIIGRGGNGGTESAADDGHSYAGATGQNGGPAIEIVSGVTGVTITNNSGGKIGGGGGGGGRANQQTLFDPDRGAGGGGGAGGGWGGAGTRDDSNSLHPAIDGYGSGGAVGEQGANGRQGPSAGVGGGGDAGGRGGWASDYRSYWGGNGGGGGGGRVFPGSGFRSTSGTAGGTGNSGGSNGTGIYAGGGGGWGASGGSGGSQSGGSGGAAIKDNGQTYTLTNNGTVYGTT